MFKTPEVSKGPEPLYDHQHKLLCWKSIFGGVLISVMAYLLLTALGAGIGGLTASHLIYNEESGSGLATGAGLWIGISAVMSLFLGGYFTLRVTTYVSNRTGAAHGFVVASIFFLILLCATGSAIGTAAKGLGKMTEAIGGGAVSMASNPAIQDTIDSAIGSNHTKSDPTVVAQGITVRLLRGDTDSAKRYYAYETGLSQSEVDTKVAQLKSDFDNAAKQAGEKAANALCEAGWSLFVTFALGLIAAVLGGREGAQANAQRPITRRHT